MLEFNQRVLRPNDLFALQYVHDARLSPDGNRVAYVTSRTVEDTEEELFEISIEELPSGERYQIGHRNAKSPRWSPDGKRLAFIGKDGSTHRLYIADTGSKAIRVMTPEDVQVQGPLAWSPDGAKIAYTLVTHRRREGLRRITKRVFRSEGIGTIDDLELSLRLLDTRSGGCSAIELGKGVTTAIHPEFSPCGKRILFMGSDSALGFAWLGGLKVFTLELSDGRLTEVLGNSGSILTAIWSPCGERVVMAGNPQGKGTWPYAGVWVVNRDGSNLQCRTIGFVGNVGLRVHHDMPTWETSQNNFLLVPDASHAYATAVKGGCTEITRIALDGPINCEPVASGRRTCVIMDVNTRTSQLLFAASDLNSPWELHLSHLKRNEEKRLTHLNDAVLSRWPAMKFEHLEYKSSDGMPLEGWYLSRADRTGPQPTVMWIHGGPMLSVGHCFRYDLYMLAANGYGVVFANYRGSSGYGEVFMDALLDDMGARGFPDHMATVDAAISKGLANPDRLGVWGASAGGFATCWIVGHTNRFRAAVAESSVTNWSTFYYLNDTDVFVHELGGRPHEIPDLYRSRSPLTYAARCRTPTLMLHGEQDARCPIAEAEQFYRALHDAGCETEFVPIPNMKHMGDSDGPLAARRAQNEALLEWFERHL
jgi:dipeptidyl aminopeptidase/acylaminoacyl peptidase